MSWVSRIVNAFRGRTLDDGLEDEYRFHMEQRAGDLERQGLSREEAEAEARRRVGSPLRLREASRDIKAAAWLANILADVRFGARMLRKHGTASLAAIASLALAIGACTTSFTLIDGLIFRPLPLPDPHQLIDVAHVMPAFFSPDKTPRESDSFSYPLYEAFRDAARGEADLFAMGLSPGFQPATFEGMGGETQNVRAELVSGRAFNILGVKATNGRLIEAGDDGIDVPPVAVLSYAFWKNRLGGSAAAIGHWVRIGRTQYQVVGVAAESFSGVQPGYLTDLWLPLKAASDARTLANPDGGNVAVWGRLHDGVMPLRVHERLQPVFTNYLRERVRINPPRNLHGAMLQQFTDAPLHVRDASSGRNSLFRLQFRRPLWILALICGLVLLMACSNVANLMIARASARAAEMALRVSLGAGRSRLIQQMLIESGQLAVIALALGLLFAAFAAPSIVARLGSTEFPAWLDVSLDARALGFAVGLTLLTALLFGIVPAVRASAAAPNTMLKADGPQHSGRSGWLRWILASQVGFSVAVLFLSGLLLLSFGKLLTLDLGFSRQNVVLFDLAPRDRDNRHVDSGAALLDHMRRLPEVESASLSQQRPMGGDMVWIMTPFVRMPGRGVETVRPREVPVSAGFFHTMQIRWLEGRDFLPEEIAAKSKSVVVNQAFVDQFFRGRDPIGQQFDKLTDDPDPIPQQIIGVAANSRYNNVREPEQPSIYTPLRAVAGATLNVRTRSQSASLIPALRREIETSAPELMVRSNILLESQIDNTLLRERLLAMLAGFFSILSFLIAGVGLYGVTNYDAIRRTREIGIRMALGARRGSVVRLIVFDTSIPVIAGIALGTAIGFALARYLTSQLFEVKSTDFWSLAAPLACILLCAIAAALPPALRASAADPLTALRHE